eukprot:gene34610-42694_t
MEAHYKVCPYEPLSCPFFGTKCNDSCNGWVPRKDWDTHTQDGTNMNIVIRVLFNKVDRLESDIAQLSGTMNGGEGVRVKRR